MAVAWVQSSAPLWGHSGGFLTKKSQHNRRESHLREVGDPAHNSGDAFDRWLSDKLGQLYGPVLKEPIPEYLLELIEAHRRTTPPEE